jgi:hypothetical protein
MTTPWDQLIDTIERRKQQLDDVLTAYRDFREKLSALPPEIAAEAEAILTGKEDTTKHDIPKNRDEEFAGKSSLECAQIILSENGNIPMHYSELASQMLDRGYRGRSGGTAEDIAKRAVDSLWAALSRSEDFTKTGNGFYCMKRPTD